MKKAVGELSSGVIVAVAVGVLTAFFYYVVWPVIDNNFASQTKCDKAICSSDVDDNGKVECRLKTGGATFYCNYKG